MKRIQTITAILCAVACAFTTAFADDDSGLVSAAPSAPVITDPVNPTPGMIFSAYGAYNWMYLDDIPKLQVALKESLINLPKAPAVKTGIDKSDKFIIDCAKGVETYAIRWEGFLRCKKARTYTFVVQKPFRDNPSCLKWRCGYAIAINGKPCLVSYGQDSFDVNLKIGFNKVEIVTLLPRYYSDVQNSPLFISAKPKGSVIEPVMLSPGKLFYDNRPEWMETGL